MKFVALAIGIFIIGISFVPSAFALTEYRIYIADLPEWADYASNVMYDATKFWEENNSNLKFYEVDDPAFSDFSVQWVKEFGTENVGYAFGSQFIEVGLGDSLCGDKWQPYSANYVAGIMEHEMGHVLGLEHSDDPNDIMYPTALNFEYGIMEQDVSFTEDYAWFIPVCTSKQVTTFNYEVDTGELTYGFDIYFVPSSKALDQYAGGKAFDYYAGNGCKGENYLQFGGTCESVSSESGLLVIAPSKLTNSLTTVAIKLQEVSQQSKQTTEIPKIAPTNPITPTNPDITVSNSYDLYVDPQQRFSIKYPSSWIIDNQSTEEYMVGFYDKNEWTSSIFILYAENIEYAGLSDQKILAEIDSYEKEFCNTATYDVDSFVCYSYQSLNQDVFSLSSVTKSYDIAYTTTRQYNDPNFPGEYTILTTLTEVHDGNNAWLVYTETDEYAYETFKENLQTSVDSFKLIKSSNKPPSEVPTLPTPAPNPIPQSSEGIVIGSAELGTVKIDQETYVIAPYEQTQIKIYGTVVDPNKGDRIALTFTYPDGTTNGNLVFPTSQGYYENYLILDYNSPRGEYEVLVSMKRQIAGIMTFNVVEKTNTITETKPEIKQPEIQPLPEKESDSQKFTAKFIDPTKDPQHYVDRYNNEPEYKEWFDTNYSQYSSIYEAVGLPEPDEKKLPDWVRNIFIWYGEGQISENDLINAIEFLVNEGIIKVKT